MPIKTTPAEVVHRRLFCKHHPEAEMKVPPNTVLDGRLYHHHCTEKGCDYMETHKVQFPHVAFTWKEDEAHEHLLVHCPTRMFYSRSVKATVKTGSLKTEGAKMGGGS